MPTFEDVERPAIMVVDDDEDIRVSMADLLQEEGYLVLSAANGREALELLGRTIPCIMLLDLMMPVMNGWELMRHMEDDPRLSSVQVCIFSAVAEQAPERAIAVLQKPISVDRLMQVVSAHCAPRSV